mgnify:CR=1 FL=1
MSACLNVCIVSDDEGHGYYCDECPERRPVQLPTLPGKVDGIVNWDPLVLQCRACGTTYQGGRERRGFDIILSGYGFHTCEPGSGRHCRDCLAAVEAACPSPGRHQ